MQVITTVTQKGQVTLPKKIREHIGIGIYNKVFVEAKDDYIAIKPAFDIFEIAGTMKPKKKKPVLQARKNMEKQYRRF